MAAPARTFAHFVPYKQGAGGDLVVSGNDPDDTLRLWLPGETYPRIVLDPGNSAVKVGTGSNPPAVIAGAAAGSVINAKAFGAVGDGIADDTLAIQTALTAALTLIIGYAIRGYVYLPAGFYKTSNTLTMGAYVQMHGDGPTATILIADVNFAGTANLSTVAVASNGVDTAGAAFLPSSQTGVLNATSIPAGTPTVGALVVATSTTPALITYAGITGNQFTGCYTNPASVGGLLQTNGSIKLAAPQIRCGVIGAGLTTDCFVANMTVDGNNAAAVGWYCQLAQENCGAENTVFNGHTQRDIWADNSSNNGLSFKNVDAATYAGNGVNLRSVPVDIWASQISINRLTAIGAGFNVGHAADSPCALRLYNTNVFGSSIHVEGASDGVREEGSCSGVLLGVAAGDGVANITNLIRRVSANTILHGGLNLAAATNLFKDDATGVLDTTGSLGLGSFDTVGGLIPAIVLTPTASPWQYQNLTARTQWITIQGGTGTLVEAARFNGTFRNVFQQAAGTFAGVQVIVRPGDYFRLTYTVAPTCVAYPQ